MIEYKITYQLNQTYQDKLSVWQEKIAKYLQKLPKNESTRKIKDFGNFTKIA